MMLVVGLGLGVPAQNQGAALQQTDLLADERSKPTNERTQLATPEHLKARLSEAMLQSSVATVTLCKRSTLLRGRPFSNRRKRGLLTSGELSLWRI